MPQELSRHIRDKTCKVEDSCPDGDTCHETESAIETGELNTLSLLELPIITNDNYMIVEHGTEINLNQTDAPRNAENEEASTSAESDHPVLWGCKQCDFRFVNSSNSLTQSI